MLKPLLLSEVAQALEARVVGADVAFTAVSTDSRKIEAGQLFIALVGPNFDGHDYLADVAAKGAVAALVQREVPGAALPQLVVDDTRIALGQLGALNRAAFNKPLAAVTGSSGKTTATVKEMLASILSTLGPVLATRGNLNNDLGAPLTLLELAPEHRTVLARALYEGWVHEVQRELRAPDVRLDNYLPHAIAGLSGTRTAALASDEGFCLARVGYSQAEADTLCVMAADFSDFARRQHARGWTGTGRAVAFHESIDMLMPACSIVQFWVDGIGYWLILGGEPLLNNRALVDLAWGLRIAGNKFSAR